MVPLILLLLFQAMCLSICRHGARLPPGPGPIALGIGLEGDMDTIIEDSKVQVLTTNMEWTEGPLYSRIGDFLLFADLSYNQIYRWKEGHGISVFANNTGYIGPALRFPSLAEHLGSEPLEQGSPGMAWDSEAERGLYMCQFGARRVLHVQLLPDRTGFDLSTAQVIADTWDGRSLNSPNDITVFEGRVYFTDSPFGNQLEADASTSYRCPLCAAYSRSAEDMFGIYMVSDPLGSAKTITRVAEMPGPNGLAVHAATRRMLISNTANASWNHDPFWLLYDVNPNGTLGREPRHRIVYDAAWQAEYHKFMGADLADGIESFDGGFFIAGPSGVYAMSPNGDIIGRIKSHRPLSNMALGPSHLYITAEKNIVRAKLRDIGAEEQLQSSEDVAFYDFKVSYFKMNPDGRDYIYVQGINGQFPGPTIHVRQGQRLRVRLANRLKTEAVLIHFHGFEMRSSPEDLLRPGYDGAGGVSACEIPPGDTFIYDFIVDEHPGTYWYHDHGHAEHVGVRGLFGAVVVHPPKGNSEPHADMYDGNRSDHVLILHDFWTRTTGEIHVRQHGGFSRTPTRSVEDNIIGIIPFESALVNGRGWYQGLSDRFLTQCTRICRQDEEWFDAVPLESSLGNACIDRCLQGPHFDKNAHQVGVSKGERIRLRLVNAASLYAFHFSVDGHPLKVISSDGADVEPLSVDALVISSGERYDVILEALQPVAKYWIRIRTLEAAPHEAFAVLSYLGAFGSEPVDKRQEAPVVLNCVDLGPPSATCLPVTHLRRHARQAPLYALEERRPKPHAFEIAWRGNAGLSPAHFVRILDLELEENQFENQYDGSYVQFAFPSNPPMFFGSNVTHESSATVRVEHEEYVELILQQSDRTSHPFHLHGHKFEVLSLGYPDYSKDCSIMSCHRPWYRPRTHADSLLDPNVALLKDTVYIPAGGWAVIRFRADNPGWWLLHCHMHIHLHDGMALMIDEAGEDFYNMFAQQEQGLSTRCSHAWEGTLRRHWISHWRTTKLNRWRHDTPVKGDVLPVACNCWQDPDMVMDAAPRSNYRCAHYYLCHHEVNSLDPPTDSPLSSPIGTRNRKDGRPWRAAMAVVSIVLALIMLLIRRWIDRWRIRRAAEVDIQGKRPPQIAPVLYRERNEDPLKFWDVTVQAKDGTTVLHQISGELQPGQVLGIMGPSGSGKTVLLDALGGRRQRGGLELTQGEVFLGEHSLRTEKRSLEQGGMFGEFCFELREGEKQAVRKMRGYMTQELALQENLSVFEILFFYARLHNKYKLKSVILKQLVHTWLEEISLTGVADRKVGLLSIGQQRRVALALEMMFPKKLLILDEPLAGLDFAASAKVMLLLSALARDRSTIVILTVHTPSGKLLPMFDQTMLLQRGGRVFHSGPTIGVSTFLTDLGEPLPDAWSEADWWLDVVTRWAVKDVTVPAVTRRDKADDIPVIKTATTVCRQALTAADSEIQQEREVNVFQQALLLCEAELLNNLAAVVNVFKLAEVFGLALATGLVWFTRGADDTMIGLRETVGLLFYTTAVWSIPPMFAALASVPSLRRRVTIERRKGLYSLRALLMAQAVSSQLLTLPWPVFWLLTAYALADVSGSPFTLLKMCFIIGMHVTAVSCLATAIGIVIGHAQTSLIVVVIVSQFLLVTNGFYTQLPEWLKWVSWLSPPRYTFQALLKLEYSWRDSFSGHPHLGWSSRGMPSTWIPAEMTVTFQDMKRRGLNVMESPAAPHIYPEVLALLSFIVLSRMVLLVAMHFLLHGAEQQERHNEQDMNEIRKLDDRMWRGVAHMLQTPGNFAQERSNWLSQAGSALQTQLSPFGSDHSHTQNETALDTPQVDVCLETSPCEEEERGDVVSL